MILLWGLLEDGTMQSVYTRLHEMNAKVLFVNHAEIDTTEIVFSTEPEPNYRLSYQRKNYNCNIFTAAFLRPYNFRDYIQFVNEDESSLRTRSADIFHHLIHSWAEHSKARIINRPSAEATNHSKLFQSMHINASGFLIPDSLVSNDPERILDFYSKSGNLIYKSMSSVRSIVKEFSPDDIRNRPNMGPVFFQQRIDGTNLRVHIIGEKVFACRIESAGIDYRYAQSEIIPCDLPFEIEEKCIALTSRLGLLLSGIDLIVTNGGEWYCLEVNPSPGFSYFDIREGRPIACAVAESLTALP